MAKIRREIKEGKVPNEGQNNENRENDSCVFIQRRIRGILARKYVERMREEEMEFLGMCRKKKTPEEMLRDPSRKMLETAKERKEVRQSHLNQYNDAKEVIMEEIENNQGTDIMEQMLKERREWVNE